jgi:hypothetical protein
MSFLIKAVKSVVTAVFRVASKLVFGIVGLIVGSKKSKPAVNVNRLNKTLNPEDFRKIVFGKTASAIDMRFWEVWGSGSTNYDEVLANASHRINAYKELYFENELAIDASGNAVGHWIGTVSRTTRLGAYGQTALSVGSSGQWTSAATFDGVAHMCLKWLYDEKKLPNGIPSRYTQVVEGAVLYDPRRDSTVAGGSGSHRIDDRTTWEYSPLDANGVPIGRNNALQVLWYLLGWKVPHTVTAELILTCGRGVDPTDINLATFVAAANNCEVAGYYTDCVLSTEDSHTSNEDKLSCNGLVGQLIDPGGLWSYYANVDDTANVAITLTDDDILQGGNVSWNDFAPMSDQYAQVVGKFIDPSVNSLYQERSYPIVRDATYEAALGVKRRVTQDFSTIQDALLAQRLARLRLNQAQFQGQFGASFLYRAMKSQVWSVVSYASDRFGWTKLFRVYGHTIDAENGLRLELREINSTIWAAGSVTVPTAAGAGSPYNPRQEVAVTGLAAFSYTATGADGTIVDGMLLDWDDAPANVRRTEVQYKLSAASYWQTLAPINQDTSIVSISNLLSGSTYNVRLRHITINEVESAWVNLSPNFTVGNLSNVRASDIQLAATSAVWNTITGTGKPADYADVTLTHTAAAITGQGTLATLSGVGPNQLTIGTIGESIIRNGSAETANNDGWVATGSNSAGSTFTAINTDHVTGSGAYCFALAKTAVGNAASFWSNLYPLNTNKKYVIRWWEKASVSGTSPFSFYIAEFGADGTSYNNNFILSSAAVMTTGWVKREAVYTPQGADNGFFRLFFQNGAGGAGTALTIYLDEIELFEQQTVNNLSTNAVQLGTNITRNDGTTSLTDALAVTTLGTAAGIAGQGALATLNYAQAGSTLRDSGGVILGDSAIKNLAITISADGTLVNAGGGQVTYVGLGGGAVGLKTYLTYGDAEFRESVGVTATLGNFKTSLGTAAAIAGQGSLATLGFVSLGTNVKDSGGTVLGDAAVKNSAVTINANGSLSGAGAGSVTYGGLGGGALGLKTTLTFGDAEFRETGATVATNANFKTILGTANAITGQGALATLSTVPAGRINIGDTANLILDPDLTDASYWTFGTGVSNSASAATLVLLLARSALTIGTTTTAQIDAKSSKFAVVPNADYLFTANIYVTTGFNGYMRLTVVPINTAGTDLTSVFVLIDYRTIVAATNTLSTITKLVNMPATAVSCRIEFDHGYTTTPAGTAYFAIPRSQRLSSPGLVALGDTANIVPDPEFIDPISWGFTGNYQILANTTAGEGYGKNKVRITSTTSPGVGYTTGGTKLIPVEPGRTYQASVYTKTVSGTTDNITIRLDWYTIGGTYISSVNVAYNAAGTTGRDSILAKAPSNAVWVQFYIIGGYQGTRVWEVSEPQLRIATILGKNAVANDGTTALTDATVITLNGTANAITGQGLLATRGDVLAGTHIKDSGGTILGDAAIKNSAVTISAAGLLSGAGGGTVTFGGLGGGALGIKATLTFGDAEFRESGATVATTANFKTSLGVASAIAGQGALATLGAVDLSTSQVTNKSLANLDGTANTKLTGIQSGADVTAASIPQLLSNAAVINFNADYTGALIAGQISQTVTFQRKVGSTDVSATTTWVATPSSGITCSISSIGVLSFTAVANGTVSVTAAYGGTTLAYYLAVNKIPGAAPGAGGGGGGSTSVYTGTIGSTSSSSYPGGASSEITLTCGASGQIDLSLTLPFLVSGGASGVSYHAAAKIQWKIAGGTYADVATETGDSYPAVAAVSPPSIDGSASDGEIDILTNKSGLTSGSSYVFKVLWRSTAGALLYDDGMYFAATQH